MLRQQVRIVGPRTAALEEAPGSRHIVVYTLFCVQFISSIHFWDDRGDGATAWPVGGEGGDIRRSSTSDHVLSIGTLYTAQCSFKY